MEREFKLFKGDKRNKEVNIAKLNTIKKVHLTASNSQFQRRREKKEEQIDEGNKDDDFEKNKESKKMARKTKAVHNVSNEEMVLKAKESRKWLLSVEDDVVQGDFEGQLLNHDMSHCLFIIEKDGFRVIPTDSLYQFETKRQTTTTLEEAERLLQQRQQELKKINKLEESTTTKDFKIVDSGRANLKMAGSEDELDFDIGEEFADDEEGLAPIENEIQLEKQKKELQKLRQSEDEASDDGKSNLNQSGKELQKLLKTKNVQVADESDDEADNPFNSELSASEGEESQEQPLTTSHAANKRKADSDLNHLFKRQKQEVGELTRQEVIDIISAQPGLTTKDLLKPLKSKIKADVRNRELIRDILRQVANVKDGKIFLKN